MTDEKTTQHSHDPPGSQDQEAQDARGFTPPASPPTDSGREAEEASVDAGPEATPPGLEPEEGQAEETAADPLAEVTRERDEYLDLAQRTQAEFENYRRRMSGELTAAGVRAKGELATELLGVLDNLERALEAIGVTPADAIDGKGEVEGALAQGVVLTYRELCAALERSEVEGYDPTGDKFDPVWHEAIQSISNPDAESGMVVEVLQKGYRIGDRVLRPARVIVTA